MRGSEWKKKSKGCAKVYTHVWIPSAVIDRQGFGINSAMGYSITFEGIPFDSVEDAKKYAERKYLNV